MKLKKWLKEHKGALITGSFLLGTAVVTYLAYKGLDTALPEISEDVIDNPFEEFVEMEKHICDNFENANLCLDDMQMNSCASYFQFYDVGLEELGTFGVRFAKSLRAEGIHLPDGVSLNISWDN